MSGAMAVEEEVLLYRRRVLAPLSSSNREGLVLSASD
jgi:hypothetical protein